jgi:hypothetical protein
MGNKLGLSLMAKEEKFYKAFVRDAHRISNRVEKLALPQTETAIAVIDNQQGNSGP